jgi:hypothetical protein
VEATAAIRAPVAMEVATVVNNVVSLATPAMASAIIRVSTNAIR